MELYAPKYFEFVFLGSAILRSVILAVYPYFITRLTLPSGLTTHYGKVRLYLTLGIMASAFAPSNYCIKVIGRMVFNIWMSGTFSTFGTVPFTGYYNLLDIVTSSYVILF